MMLFNYGRQIGSVKGLTIVAFGIIISLLVVVVLLAVLMGLIDLTGLMHAEI